MVLSSKKNKNEKSKRKKFDVSPLTPKAKDSLLPLAKSWCIRNRLKYFPEILLHKII